MNALSLRSSDCPFVRTPLQTSVLNGWMRIYGHNPKERGIDLNTLRPLLLALCSFYRPIGRILRL